MLTFGLGPATTTASTSDPVVPSTKEIIDYECVKAIIRRRLLNTDAVVSKTGLRIYSVELKRLRITTPSFPLIAFKIQGGVAPIMILAHRAVFANMTIFVYDRQPHGAEEVRNLHREVVAALHQTRLTDDSSQLIVVPQLLDPGVREYDSFAEAYRVQSSWRVYITNTVVT